MKTRSFTHVLMILLAIAGFSAITMLLWNALLPGIFGIASINFWQALGLLVLARVLFGGMGSGAMKHFHHRGNPIHEKWMKMTPEERMKFIDKRKRFGFGDSFYRDHFDMGEHEESEKKND